MPQDRILTTHIGSLPRPPELLELLQQRQAGEEVDPEAWERAVVDGTETAIRRQAEAGIDIVNNGEEPRVSFNWYVANRLGGIHGERDAPLWDDLEEFREYAEDAFASEIIDLTKQPAITEPVEYVGRAAAEEELDAFFDLLAESDAVSIHSPLTPQTRGMIGADELERMKESAFLLNTARGGIVDEAALADAIRAGSIAGAGLDVLESEPPADDSPLLDLDDVILTPHAAYNSAESVVELRTKAARNVAQTLTGDVPDYLVNDTVLD